MRFIRMSLLAVVLLAVGTACGGSAKKSASPTTTAAAATKQSTSTVAPSFGSAKNCVQLGALGAKIAQAMQSSSGDAQTSIANEGKALQALASAAPGEIRGDFETFASAFTAYAQAFAKVGLKPGKVPTAAQLAQMATAAKALSTPKLQAAEQHLSAWAQKNCGGARTTTTG